MNTHKKRGLIVYRLAEALQSLFTINRTTARAYTIDYNLSLKFQIKGDAVIILYPYLAQAFTVHYPGKLKILQISARNNLRKMLTIFSSDSLSRNALRCGIDAKVRSKNEIARKKGRNFQVLIRKAGI